METFVEKFGIDWKLLVAQLINFAIVFVILRAFVYKPVLRLLDKRRAKIEEGLAFAEKAKNELASIETLKEQEMKVAQQKGLAMVKDAEAAAGKVRDTVLADAETEKQKLMASGKAVLAEQKNRMEKGVYEQAVTLVEMTLGKVLAKTQFKAEEREMIAQTIAEIKLTKN